jgi:peptide deformylase
VDGRLTGFANMPEQVRLIDDPILRKKCEPVNVVDDAMFIEGLLDAMHETMIIEKGIGLAANQIGHSVQVFILKEGVAYREYINPEVVIQEELVDFVGEGCLSIPGTQGTTKRYRKLYLKWVDKRGNPQGRAFENMDAFAVQHEMDHLNGKLYVDQFGPLKKDMVLTKHRKYLRGH